MSVVSPHEPRQDELELLIREARARQLRRRLGIAALVALLAGAALGIYAIVDGRSPGTASATPHGAPVAANGSRCGIRVKGAQILQGGRIVYREPGHLVHPNGGPPAAVRCSGPSVWVVWVNGAAMSQEAYVGVRSGDAGRTWRLVFSESYFGVKAPHELDSYFGPWKLGGPMTAYFTGSCPACSVSDTSQGTVSLWVTRDGGRTFRRYTLPALTGYAPSHIRIAGREVTIVGARFYIRSGPPRRAETVRVS